MIGFPNSMQICRSLGRSAVIPVMKSIRKPPSAVGLATNHENNLAVQLASLSCKVSACLLVQVAQLTITKIT